MPLNNRTWAADIIAAQQQRKIIPKIWENNIIAFQIDNALKQKWETEA